MMSAGQLDHTREHAGRREVGGCVAGVRGAILLEVIVATGLLVFAMAVVGLRVNSSFGTAASANLKSRAILLADTKLAELNAGVVRPEVDQEMKGYFGISYPGYSWRIMVKPCEIENLFMVTLDIGYNASQVDSQIEDKDYEIDIEDDGAKIVHTSYRLVPSPADLDMGRDFGIDIDELSQMEQFSGAGSDAGPADGGDGESGDGKSDGKGMGQGAELMGMIMEFLTAHPEILNDNGGIDLAAIASLPPEDFSLAMGVLQQFTGRGANMKELEKKLSDDAFGDRAETAGSGPKRGGRRGPLGGQRGGRAGPGAGDRGGSDASDRGGSEESGPSRAR